ncbi:MAG: lysoplasmalogenase [Myxococcota bacterium]|nr:lysoplasmalogenase [Myxococcota bacterium]
MPLIACTVFVLLLLWAEHRKSPRLRGASKLAASATFIWAAFSWGGLASPFGQFIVLGLCLCALGDALLLPGGRGRWFQLGIIAFGLGHLAYAMAFIHLGVDPLATAFAAVFMLVVGWIVLRWLEPQLPSELKVPVIAYGIIISAMVTFAIGAVADQATLWIGLGAVGFAASDLSVARDRFVREQFVNAAWGLPAYYLSQFALAFSIAHTGL